VIWHVARRELIDHLQSVRFLALFLLALTLMPLGAYVNARNYQTREGFYNGLREAQQERLQSDRAPRSGFELDGEVDEGLRAIRPPAPLSVFAIGDDQTMPAYWQFGTGGLTEGLQPGVYEGLAGLLGDVDFLFVTQVVLGLLSVLLCFDAICGDRENGTLRAVLANAVPRSTLLAGKYLGGVITLIVPLFLGLLASLVVLQVMGLPIAQGALLARIALIAAGGALYLSSLLGLGILVSATIQYQRNALVALLVLWVVLVLLVPRFGAMAATRLVPVESDALTRRKISLATQAIEAERTKLLTAETRRAFDWQEEEPPWKMIFEDLTDEERDARVDDYERARKRIEAGLFEQKRQAIEGIASDRERALERQERVAGLLGRISPAAALSYLATELAESGARVRHDWQAQARQQQRQLEKLLFDRTGGIFVTFNDGRWRGSRQRDIDEPIPGYAELPVFEYQAASLGESIRGAAPDFAVLAIYNLLTLGGAAMLFSRYDVR